MEHYFLCVWAGLLIGFAFRQNGIKFALVLGIGKELYDLLGDQGFNVLDFLFVFLGSLFKEISIRLQI